MSHITFLVIPGLNDAKPLAKWFYAWVCRQWNRAGARTIVCYANWGDEESYQVKLEKIEHTIAELKGQGRDVVLIGVSAGASLAALVFTRQPESLLRLVTICGLLRLAPGDEQKLELIGKSWYLAAKACQEATPQLNAKQKQRVLCLVPIRDRVIKPERAQMAGARVITMVTSGHLLSIFAALVWYRRAIWRSMVLEVKRVD